MSVPSKAASSAAVAAAAAAAAAVDKPRILCLHGKFQSASVFYDKIAGARRKLSRAHELDFLDGPIELATAKAEDKDGPKSQDGPYPDGPAPRAWWLRGEDGRHLHVREAFDYVRDRIGDTKYDALLGFSQGGTLAAALALSGTVPGVRAVVTAGAPLVEEAFVVAEEIASEGEGLETSRDGGDGDGDGGEAMASSSSSNTMQRRKRLDMPMLHIAGERDDLVAVESTIALSKRGGGGEVVLHEQGHLFPTRAAVVNRVIAFLEKTLDQSANDDDDDDDDNDNDNVDDNENDEKKEEECGVESLRNGSVQ